MPDRHKHQPITFRPPERDRLRLLAYAQRTGQPVRKIIAQALTAFLDRAGQDAAEPSTSSPDQPERQTPVVE